MILLVTPSSRREQCAAALHEATDEDVALAVSLREATGLLRASEYLVVVLDQYLIETEPEDTNTLMEHLGTATPVQVNLAISGMDRVVREVRTAQQRRKHEEVIARRAAQEALQSELNGTVTALLLHCDLAIASPDLPPAALHKLQTARDLVDTLRAQLQTKSS